MISKREERKKLYSNSWNWSNILHNKYVWFKKGDENRII